MSISGLGSTVLGSRISGFGLRVQGRLKASDFGFRELRVQAPLNPKP